jgi:cytochrome P460
MTYPSTDPIAGAQSAARPVGERRHGMRRIVFVLIAVAALTGIIASSVGGIGRAAQEAAPVFVKKVPPGYRDWKVVSVAHEAGELNDIRAVLGNDIAIRAYREGKLPFPEGAIVGRIAWSYVASEENNKTFGREQSFVAGSPTDFYLQFMVKDSKKYAATGGWGYSSFGKDGTPTDDAAMTSCFPCHQAIKGRDFIFTRYAR